MSTQPWYCIRSPETPCTHLRLLQICKFLPDKSVAIFSSNFNVPGIFFLPVAAVGGGGGAEDRGRGVIHEAALLGPHPRGLPRRQDGGHDDVVGVRTPGKVSLRSIREE